MFYIAQNSSRKRQLIYIIDKAIYKIPYKTFLKPFVLMINVELYKYNIIILYYSVRKTCTLKFSRIRLWSLLFNRVYPTKLMYDSK